VFAYLYTVLCTLYGIALLNTSDSGTFRLAQQVMGAVVGVAGVVMLGGLRRARVTVDADGITRRWLRTTHWRWNEISSLGPTSSWPRPWMAQLVQGRQQRLVPWMAANLNMGSAVDQWFVDELTYAAHSAGLTVGTVGRSSDGSPLDRVAAFFGRRRRPPGPPGPPSA
jgi:hypothetical protein